MIAFVRSVILRSTSVGIEVQRLRVDLGEDRDGAASRDRLGRCKERERGADHLVTLTDPERVERDHDRICAVRDSDCLLHAEVFGRLALETVDLGTEDEPAGLECPRKRLLQLRNQRRVLRLDVNVRNWRHGEPW